MKWLLSFILCILAGQVFVLCHIPLGMMFGPLITVFLLSRFVGAVPVLSGSITLIQLSLGISIGLLMRDFPSREAGEIGPYLGLLLLCLSLQFALCYFWCRRKLGWSKDEALLGAVPGAMAAVLALASHIKTPPQKIVISHSLRLIVLTLLAGFISRGGAEGSLIPASVAFYSVNNLLWLTVIVAAGYALGKLLERYHFPAPFMLTSLFCAAAMHPLAAETLYFPDVFNQLSMVLMGMLLGHHFTLFSLPEFGRHLWSSLQLIAIGLGITVVMAWIASLLVDYPFYLLLLSWVPGSVETMSFAALMLKADAGFVMANHLVRMLLIHTLPALAIYRQSRQSQKLS